MASKFMAWINKSKFNKYLFIFVVAIIFANIFGRCSGGSSNSQVNNNQPAQVAEQPPAQSPAQANETPPPEEVKDPDFGVTPKEFRKKYNSIVASKSYLLPPLKIEKGAVNDTFKGIDQNYAFMGSVNKDNGNVKSITFILAPSDISPERAVLMAAFVGYSAKSLNETGEGDFKFLMEMLNDTIAKYDENTGELVESKRDIGGARYYVQLSKHIGLWIGMTKI